MSLFAGNVSHRASPDEVRAFFAKFGPCRVDVKRGYAFIDYDDDRDADDARNDANGKDFHGMKLNVEWSKKHLARTAGAAGGAPPGSDWDRGRRSRYADDRRSRDYDRDYERDYRRRYDAPYERDRYDRDHDRDYDRRHGRDMDRPYERDRDDGSRYDRGRHDRDRRDRDRDRDRYDRDDDRHGGGRSRYRDRSRDRSRDGSHERRRYPHEDDKRTGVDGKDLKDERSREDVDGSRVGDERDRNEVVARTDASAADTRTKGDENREDVENGKSGEVVGASKEHSISHRADGDDKRADGLGNNDAGEDMEADRYGDRESYRRRRRDDDDDRDDDDGYKRRKTDRAHEDGDRRRHGMDAEGSHDRRGGTQEGVHRTGDDEDHPNEPIRRDELHSDGNGKLRDDDTTKAGTTDGQGTEVHDGQSRAEGANGGERANERNDIGADGGAAPSADDEDLQKGTAMF